MNRHQREIALALKRQRLQFHAAAQRQELAAAVQPFTPLFAGADKVNDGVHYLKAHPETLAAAAIVMAVLRPARSFRWARRAFSAWRLWGRLKVRLYGS